MSTRPNESILSKITRDHKNINACYEEYAKLHSNPHLQKKWKNELIFLIAQHSVAEELVVYPKLDKCIENGKNVHKNDLEEHGKIKQMLALIDQDLLGVKEEQKTMEEVINNFRRHAKEEEESQLPALQRALVNEELVKMGKNFDLAKKASPTHPHPAAPDTPKTGEAIVGMMTAPWDRLRDVFRTFPPEQELKKVIEV